MTIYIRLDMDGQFYVEHLVKTSRRRSLNLVRTIPGHLIRTSKAKFEFSAAGICRILSENESQTKFELSLGSK